MSYDGEWPRYLAYLYPADEGPPRIYRRDGIVQCVTLRLTSFVLQTVLHDRVLIYREVGE